MKINVTINKKRKFEWKMKEHDIEIYFVEY